jgi:hypothetical protein
MVKVSPLRPLALFDRARFVLGPEDVLAPSDPERVYEAGVHEVLLLRFMAIATA